MYSRKLRQNVKQRKTSFSKKSISSWGPRVALYEREKAIGSGNRVPTTNECHNTPPPFISVCRSSKEETGIKPSNHGDNRFFKYMKQGRRTSSVSYSSISSSAGPGHSGSSGTASNHVYSVYNNMTARGSGKESSEVNYGIYQSRDGRNLWKPLSLVIPMKNACSHSYKLDFECDQDSLASTQTYHSSSGYEDDDKIDSKSEPFILKDKKRQGILQISTTKLQVHSEGIEKETSKKVNDRKYSSWESTLRDLVDKSPSATLKGKVDGSEITALAQGITMVYVPMESISSSKSAATIMKPKPIDDINAPRESEDDNSSTSSSFDESNFEPRSSSTMECRGDGKENFPLDDSLLEVNNSVLFNQGCADFVGKTDTAETNLPTDQIIRLDKEPKIEKGKGKLIRFVIDNVQKQDANVDGLILNSPKVGTTYNPIDDEKLESGASALKFPNEAFKVGKTESDNMYELCKNEREEEIEILSCGHAILDSYSTISSLQSSVDSCVDELLCRETKKNEQSALDQLRDLSILIGGRLTPDQNKSFHLHEAMHAAKIVRSSKEACSDPYHDSGKGSGSNCVNSDASNIQSTPNSSEDSGPCFPANSSNPSVHIKSGIWTQEKDKHKMTCNKKPVFFDLIPGKFQQDCTDCIESVKRVPHQSPAFAQILCSSSARSRSSKESSSSKCCTGNRKKLSHKKASMKLKRAPLSKASGLISPRKSSKHDSTKSKDVGSNKKPAMILDYCECSQCKVRSSGLKKVIQSDMIDITSGHPPKSNSDKDIRAKSNNSDGSRPWQGFDIGSSYSGKQSGRKVSYVTIIRNSDEPQNDPFPESKKNLSGNGLFTIEEGDEGIHLFNRKECATMKAAIVSRSRHKMGDETSVVEGCSRCSSSREWGCQTTKPHECLKAHEFKLNDFVFEKEEKDYFTSKNWISPDAVLGWSDLESLYSLNMKCEKPVEMKDECWTCWAELAENKRNALDPMKTVERTKRMFIWLNKRHKEFHAPWWEAKKQASIRWLVTKASSHLGSRFIEDPFKESKKGKPAKYRLKDDVMKGLVNGKLYCSALENLYNRRSSTLSGSFCQGLSHWDIIKILSRRGIYVAQPSDMKLTEGTLRQKPIRITAHIALIEAMMGLYAKEVLERERLSATLHSFGITMHFDSPTPEQYAVSWINSAIITIKSYVRSNRKIIMEKETVSRWMQVRQVQEIRDLCDGVGLCALLALYCSNDLKVEDIIVPEPGETLSIYDSISNHSLVQKACNDIFPHSLYHVCITDFLYIHGYMKQNILSFIVDLFNHFEVDPVHRVNRLTHIPVTVQL